MQHASILLAHGRTSAALILAAVMAGACCGCGAGLPFFPRKTTEGARPVDLTGDGTIGLYARLVRRESLINDIAGLNVDHRAICVVTKVLPGGPADQAGLKRGDWLLRVSTTKLIKVEAIIDLVRKTRVGTTLIFTIRRSGQSMQMPVTVGSLTELRKRLMPDAKPWK